MSSEEISNERQLYSTIGGMNTSIKSLVVSQKEVKDKLDTVTNRVTEVATSMVTKEDCDAHRQAISTAIGKKQTRPDNLAVGFNPNISSASIPLPARGQTSFADWIRRNIGLISATLGVLALLGTGVVKVAYLIVGLDSAIQRTEKRHEATSATLKKELREVKEAAQEPRVVYIPVPSTPDAGVPARRARRHRRPARPAN